jgi:hypothetical protein
MCGRQKRQGLSRSDAMQKRHGYRPLENPACPGGRRLYAFRAARTLMLMAEHAVRGGASGILRGGGTAMRLRDNGKRLRARDTHGAAAERSKRKAWGSRC